MWKQHVILQYFDLFYQFDVLLIPTVADVQWVVFPMQATGILTKNLTSAYSSAKNKIISFVFEHKEPESELENSEITQGGALH